MDIDLAGFSPEQRLALFDLLVLAMYADGHLTTGEDEKLQQLLTAMGHTEESDRQREFDAAVTRMRPAVQSLHKARERAGELATAFTSRPQQKAVFALVQSLMTGDGHVSTWESALLTELESKFR